MALGMSNVQCSVVLDLSLCMIDLITDTFVYRKTLNDMPEVVHPLRFSNKPYIYVFVLIENVLSPDFFTNIENYYIRVKRVHYSI